MLWSRIFKLQGLLNHWVYSVSNEVDMFMLTLDDLAPSCALLTNLIVHQTDAYIGSYGYI